MSGIGEDDEDGGSVRDTRVPGRVFEVSGSAEETRPVLDRAINAILTARAFRSKFCECTGRFASPEKCAAGKLTQVFTQSEDVIHVNTGA